MQTDKISVCANRRWEIHKKFRTVLLNYDLWIYVELGFSTKQLSLRALSTATHWTAAALRLVRDIDTTKPQTHVSNASHYFYVILYYSNADDVFMFVFKIKNFAVEKAFILLANLYGKLLMVNKLLGWQTNCKCTYSKYKYEYIINVIVIFDAMKVELDWLYWCV